MDEKTIIGIVGVLLGAVSTYLVAVLKLRREVEYKYDTDLRDKRIPQYLALWKLLEDLAKYARLKQPTFDDLQTHRVFKVVVFRAGRSLSVGKEPGIDISPTGRDQGSAGRERGNRVRRR